MDVVFQDSDRDRREQQRQRLFRDKFVAETPPWYHGALHLGFTLLVTGYAMWLCWTRIHNAGLEWLLVIPIALFGNWIEWAAHRYILHRPVKGLEMIYKRHCTVHHQFFTHHDLTYHGHKEWRALFVSAVRAARFRAGRAAARVPARRADLGQCRLHHRVHDGGLLSDV
jgi:hypothetical protein